MTRAKEVLKTKGSTLFLRLSLIGMALVALLLSVLVPPTVYKDWPQDFPEIELTKYPVILCLYLAALAFWTGVFHGWKILNYVDSGKAFSELSVKALGAIKLCAFTISGMFAALWPVVFYFAELDDSPGMIIIYGIIFVCAPLIVAVGLGVLQRLLHEALLIKSENDLTV